MKTSINKNFVPKDKRSVNSLQNVDIDLIKILREKEASNPGIWSSKKSKRRDNVHAFFLYPAMMVPAVQWEVINVIKQIQPNISILFDPYVGSGTSLVAGLLNGLDCYGQDINPLAVLLSKVKTGVFQYKTLSNKANKLLKRAKSLIITKPFVFKNSQKWFRNDVATELTKLRKSILMEPSLFARRFFWITLSETIRRTSNDRMSTYKLHSHPVEISSKRFISPLAIFEKLIKKNLEDLNSFKESLNELNLLNKNDKYINKTYVSIVDSMMSALSFEPNIQCDIIVTSPPYGDNKTTIPYGQHSYLPLQWIDLNDIEIGIKKSILETTLAIDSKSIGGTISKFSKDELDKLFSISPKLKQTIKKLEKNGHGDKKKKVLQFFYDLDKSIMNIVNSIKKNGYIFWTVGNRFVGGKEIPNDIIMKEIFENKGCVLVTELERDILNKKMPFKNNFSNTMKKEKILILRKSEK